MSLGGTGHRTLTAKLSVDPDTMVSLLSPGVGVLRSVLSRGDLVQPGSRIGWLYILGRAHEVVAPAGAWGRVGSETTSGSEGPRGVGFAEVLFLLEAIEGGTELAVSNQEAQAAEGANVVRAPSSGRFYARPAPDEPSYIEAGQVVEPGHTLCLLEVMKTFNRVSFSAEDCAGPVRVVSCLVQDGEDVDKGQALFAFEPV